MALRKYADAVAVNGTYQDKDGVEKRRYQKVGTLLFDPDKKYFKLKMDLLPVGKEFDGWISFFKWDKDEKAKSEQPDGQDGSDIISDGEPVDLSGVPF